MIAYTTFGTNDFAKATAFYDKLLGALGAKRVLEMDRLIAWGNSPTAPMVAVCKPYDGGRATPGNGTMISLAAPTKADVDKMHKLALELGGKDEGAPGQRGPGFYIGYFRDLDGNKLNFFAAG
jgi:catechol 2,3-dioxygenase-like lactoylglutathione lyase family enzyme